jgi:hypothetical protein
LRSGTANSFEKKSHLKKNQPVMKSPAFAAIILETQGASHGALAESVSTHVPIQFHRRLGYWRVDVSRGARVDLSARLYLT